MRRTANFYWGNKTLPFLRYLTLYSFRKYNPDWNINLYYPKVIQEECSWNSPEHKLKITGEDYFNRVEELNISLICLDMERFGLSNEISEVKKSDILRWDILGKESGLWSDMDILFIKPIPNFSNKNVISLRNRIWSIGFLYNSTAQEFFKYLYEESFKRIHQVNYQSIGSTMLKELFGGFNLRNVRIKFPKIPFTNLSLDVVYPMNFSEAPIIFEACEVDRIKETTVGLHWFAGDPLSGKYQNLLTEETYKKYDSTISSLISKVLE